jgi:hypothetical protein
VVEAHGATGRGGNRIEKYAPGIGLIYKEILDLKYCTVPSNCLGYCTSFIDCIEKDIILSGLIYKQSIIAYGDE